MAKIEKLKKGAATIYPATIPQAVVDPASGKSAREELDEKANHGYDSSPKTLKEIDDSVSQLAGEVSQIEVKDAIQDSKIKDIENVLSTANLNQSAQLSVSGRKTISLPKNAANGGMSVKLEGFTSEQLMVNGDFKENITGWSSDNSTSVWDNGTLINTADGSISYGRVWKEIPVYPKQGDKLYVSADVTALTAIPNSIQILVRNGKDYPVESIHLNTPSVGVKHRHSVVQELAADYNLGVRIYVLQSYSSPSEALGKQMRVENVKVINLTETFGAGNEPTKEQCDLMFSDYFEGVKSFEPTGRVRSVGKNLLDKYKVVPNAYTTVKQIENGVNITGKYFAQFKTRLPAGYEYRMSWSETTVSGTPLTSWRFCYIDGTLSISSPSGGTRFAEKEVSEIYLYVSGEIYASADFTNIILSRDIIAFPYEPYKETNLYLTAPELRSNGLVKDEIRKGTNGYELVKRISDVDGSVLTTPEITPISYGGILNSAENGTVYHEPIIADAGVYETKMDILLTDYPIASIEEIIKHENGVDTYLDVATAVVASDGLSFTHPDLADGDLVLFTYAFDKESTNGNITATFYDSNVVKIDTVTGKAYKIEDVVTNGVLTRTLTEV